MTRGRRPHLARKRLEAQSHSIENFHMEDIHSFFWWDSKVEVGAATLHHQISAKGCGPGRKSKKYEQPLTQRCTLACEANLCNGSKDSRSNPEQVPFAVLMEAISADHPYNLPMIVSSALPADGEA